MIGKQEIALDEFMRDLKMNNIGQLISLPEICVMSNDRITSLEFLSWMMGKKVLDGEERYAQKHGDQTIFLLGLVDSASIEKYMLNDESLFLIIGDEAPVSNRSQTLHMCKNGDEWTINDVRVTNGEMWNRLGEWQMKQYGLSVARIPQAISKGLKLRDEDLKDMRDKCTVSEYPVRNRLACVKSLLESFWDQHILTEDRCLELEIDLKERWQTLRLATEVMKPVSKSECIADIKERIIAATKDGSRYFVHEKVFNDIMDSYVIQDTTLMCRAWCQNVQDEIKTKLFEYLDVKYGHLNLCAELKKRFDNEFAANINLLAARISEAVPSATIAESTLFNEIGEVDMDEIERSRTNSRVSRKTSRYDGIGFAEEKPWQPEFESSTEIEDIIAYEMFSRLYAVGNSQFLPDTENATLTFLYFDSVFDKVIPLEFGSHEPLYRFCNRTREFTELENQCNVKIEQFKKAGAKFQEFKKKLMER